MHNAPSSVSHCSIIEPPHAVWINPSGVGASFAPARAVANDMPK